jgi:hypothetical protein
MMKDVSGELRIWAELAMKYKLNFSPKVNVSAPPVTGAVVGPAAPAFFAWQPSTWPVTPAAVDEPFIYVLKQIFEESILGWPCYRERLASPMCFSHNVYLVIFFIASPLRLV